jgi:DNA transposition AAA+ family ATPase
MPDPISTSPADDHVSVVPQANFGNNIRASWNMSRDDIVANIDRYPAEAKHALLSAFAWCIDPRHPMAKPDFARRVGASDNLVYKLYSGKYRDTDGNQLCPSPELIKAIYQFLELEKERYEAGENQFVTTPTARKISTSCELARESNSVVIMWGPSHIGKTWAMVHHTAQNNHGRTIYARMRAASGRGGMVRRLADCIGISDKSNTDALVARIKNAVTQDMLLILDECHLLFNTYQRNSADACFETLREIHDETKCGMVLAFTILDELRARSARELQQLWRRGVHKVPLPLMPTKDDLKAILSHNGIAFPDAKDEVEIGGVTERPYEVLRQLAKLEGLKAITERLRYGRKLANRSHEDLAWSHVIEAHLRIAKQAQQVGEWH